VCSPSGGSWLDGNCRLAGVCSEELTGCGAHLADAGDRTGDPVDAVDESVEPDYFSRDSGIGKLLAIRFGLALKMGDPEAVTADGQTDPETGRQVRSVRRPRVPRIG
jgi:hypothetical protein